MKTKTLLIAAVMFFALSVSAFAQSAFTVSQETLDKVACCGLAEPTGSIAFTTVADTAPSVTGTITLRYNLPIANLGSGILGVQVTAVNNLGVLLATQPTWLVDNDDSNGRVVIAVPMGYTYPTKITVSNVRVNVSGSTCGTDTSVTANASSTGNLLTIGETTSITLVKGTARPLKDPAIPSPVNLNAADGSATGTGAISISENFITAFGITSTFPELTRSQQTMIRLTVSAIPAGMSIRFPQISGNFEASSADGLTAVGGPVTLSTSAIPQSVYYRMTAASNPAATDVFTVTPTVLPVGPYPLAPSSIKVSAAMGPLTLGTTATAYPQFVEGCETAQVTLVNIAGALNTVLLVPYATTEIGYDTALTVANTTLDPGAAAMGGFPQAIRQTGKITVYFYNKDLAAPAIAPWVSTGHPNQYGLDAAGKLPPGGLFVALLNELLPASVQPGSFGGYIFIVTDFTNAHGEYFVSDFENLMHGALMLVINDLSRVSAGRTQEQGLNQ